MLARNVLSTCRRRECASFNTACKYLTTTAQSADVPVASTSAGEPTKQTKKHSRPRLTASVVLNRSPIITKTPTDFEEAYYAYQARIRRALHNPFPYEFYFKQGSLLETRYNLEERTREVEAFGTRFISEDGYAGSDPQPEGTQLAKQEGEDEIMMPRVHPSDESGDVKSLDRHGQRNLYLLVRAKKDGKDVWRFPQGDVQKGELLHQAAQRDLFAECGQAMDTWIVSRNPIGHYKPTQPESSSTEPEEVTFFFKAHIMAGQVRPEGKVVQEFAWLTKEEIESRVDKEYWDGVKDMLSDF